VTNRFDNIKSLRDMEKPMSQGGMSMGEGRKLAPYGKCDKSPDGMHHYTAVANLNSVEHFVCDYCPDNWWD
jgi:hypothetical protein